MYKDARSGPDLKALRRALRINQTTFWKGLQATQSGGSRYESGRNIPASIRALVILVFGSEQHARQQLDALRNPLRQGQQDEVAGDGFHVVAVSGNFFRCIPQVV
jgi:predicted transcriptional regulator